MKGVFVLPIRLHSLNEYIGACRRNAKQGARMKRTDQEIIIWHIKAQMKGVRFRRPVRMVYKWYEPNKKRDLDNISSYGRKVIQDALVECGVLGGDGWNYISGFRDEFYIDTKQEKIIVEIFEG